MIEQKLYRHIGDNVVGKCLGIIAHRLNTDKDYTIDNHSQYLMMIIMIPDNVKAECALPNMSFGSWSPVGVLEGYVLKEGWPIPVLDNGEWVEI